MWLKIRTPRLKCRPAELEPSPGRGARNLVLNTVAWFFFSTAGTGVTDFIIGRMVRGSISTGDKG